LPVPRSLDVKEEKYDMWLEGDWRVERVGGLLPPLIGVSKRISDGRGETRIGRLPGVSFDVDDLRLRYRAPFSGFVDVLEPDGQGFAGRATFHGWTFGRFRMRPAE
jgi:hypothetical protein